jgi:hypothetical protein
MCNTNVYRVGDARRTGRHPPCPERAEQNGWIELRVGVWREG